MYRNTQRVIYIIFLLFLIEIGAYFALRVLPSSLVYRPFPITESAFSTYMQRRNDVTGWPANGDDRHTWNGARFSPLFSSTNEEACLAVFGDSFAWGDGVAADEAWPELLAKARGCAVANYGVGGFGSDQALLRFLSLQPTGKKVLLTFIAENILRNVNQYRDLLYPSTGFGLKPVFSMHEQKLFAHPLPRLTYSEYLEFIQAPAQVLEHEFFVPGGESGIQSMQFPYVLTGFRLFKHFHVRSKLNSAPRYLEFYLPGHTSNALQTTFHIIKAFQVEAERMNRQFSLILLPLCDELDYFLHYHTRITEPLLKQLDEAKVPYIDLFPVFLNANQEGGFEQYFQSCSGHYNAKGNSFVAKHLNLALSVER